MKVNIGVVGCGFMAQGVHIPCFQDSDGCNVAALCDSNEDLCAKVARKFGISKTYSSTEDLFADSEIDAVCLIVPPQFLASMAISAMDAGKHVFCEKPIALKMEDGRAMVEKSAKTGKILMGAYMKRYDLGVQEAKRVLEENKSNPSLGKVTYARFHNFGGVWVGGGFDPKVIVDDTRKSYEEIGDLRIPEFVLDEDRTRYFCSFINFSHDINLMRYLLGDPMRVKASSQRPAASDFCSFTTSIFEYDGFCATLETGSASVRDWDEECKIYFENGWIEIKFPPVLLQNVPASVSVYSNDKVLKRPDLGWGWNFKAQADHFIDCIVGNKCPISSGSDSIKDIAVGEAWYKSYADMASVDIIY
jgi:predicted dehydrogenase